MTFKQLKVNDNFIRATSVLEPECLKIAEDKFVDGFGFIHKVYSDFNVYLVNYELEVIPGATA